MDTSSRSTVCFSQQRAPGASPKSKKCKLAHMETEMFPILNPAVISEVLINGRKEINQTKLSDSEHISGSKKKKKKESQTGIEMLGDLLHGTV